MKLSVLSLFLCLAAIPFPLGAQDELTLAQAVSLAIQQNPAVEATAAQTRAAAEGIQQAKANYMPKLNYQESYTRSNNQVFVFGTLLTQKRFTADRFQINSLNNPASVQNFQSLVVADQLIYDFGMTKNNVRSAELKKTLAGEDERRIQMQLIAAAQRAYFGAVLAEESLRVAEEAVKSAEADLARAETIRAAGMSTDADVLSIRVHLAAVREQRIRGASDVAVAHAALNQVLGLPLDTPHRLASKLVSAPVPDGDLREFEMRSMEQRPEAQQATLTVQLAESQKAVAKSAYWPQFFIRGAFEADRNRFVTEGGGNWLAAAMMKWNLFDGNERKSRVRGATEMLRGAQAQQKQVQQSLKLEVRQAYFDLRAARERIEVAQAAVSMAEESLRITKNRFEAGLANTTELLRNETALLETRTRYLAAVYDQRVAAAQLELAKGTLQPDSPVLQ